jgi:hypothetical protein
MDMFFITSYEDEDGSRYEGFWRDGCPNGKGKFWTASGDIYEGEFIDS